MSAQSTTIACLDILRRIDPRDTKNHLSNLSSLISDDDVVDELYQRVDVPLKVAEDTNTKEKCKFLLSEHNRDGDSYRSPWSDTYFPPFEEGDGFHPSERLRPLELHANEVFNV